MNMWKNHILKQGYIMVSKSYKNSHTKLIIKDFKGYFYYTTWDNLQSGRNPNFVSTNNIFSIKNIRND